MEAGGIALAIPGDGDNPLCDDLTHYTSSPETSKRFAGLVESLAHCRGRGVVERNILDRNTTHRDLPKTYERERGSVSQSPRLEAVSMMQEPWSFDGGMLSRFLFESRVRSAMGQKRTSQPYSMMSQSQ